MDLIKTAGYLLLVLVSISLSNAEASFPSNYNCRDYISAKDSIIPGAAITIVNIRLVIDGFVGAAKLYSNDRRIISDMRAFYGKVSYYCRQDQSRTIIQAADLAWRE